MSATKIVMPPGVHDPRVPNPSEPPSPPQAAQVTECPKCKAPKDMLLGGPRRFPVIKKKLICGRCGEVIPVG